MIPEEVIKIAVGNKLLHLQPNVDILKFMI